VIVLDASVLIGYLDAEDGQHQAAESLLAREIDDDFAASSLTLTEVLVGPVRADRTDDALAALRISRSESARSQRTPPFVSPGCAQAPDCECRTAACSWRPRKQKPAWPPSTAASHGRFTTSEWRQCSHEPGPGLTAVGG
jgi:hypothetical protein